jgi:hypothetical protein
VANYDTQPGREGQTPAKAPVIVGTRTFKFAGGRLESAVNEDVMFARTNPLAALQGNASAPPAARVRRAARAAACAPTRTRARRGSTGSSSGARSSADPTSRASARCRTPSPSTRATPLIFQSRIATSAPSGQGLDSVRQNPSGLAATVMVDGRSVALQGTTTGTTLSFSFTSR